jgi:predicted metal-dependent hydrolase
MAERYPEQYRQFFHKFHAGQYYECHDLLEEIWLEDRSDKFLQGLLQLAVGLYHYECGNVKGARWMFGNARKYLTRYLPVHGNLELAPVIAYIDDCLRRLPDAERIPYEEAKRHPLPRFTFVLLENEEDDRR